MNYLKDKEFKYIIEKSSRAKNITIKIDKNGEIILVIPKSIPKLIGIKFLEKSKKIVLKKQEEILKKIKEQKIPKASEEDFYKYKKVVNHFNMSIAACVCSNFI